MTRLFITGATGYIGGDVLHAISKVHPEIEITALVRNSEKGARVAAQHPNIRLVYGDLENLDLLTKEAASADIVVNTANCGHLPSAEALIAGLAQQQSNTYLLHVSGTGNLTYEDLGAGTFGIEREQVFNDWDGLDIVTSLPDGALWRNVEKVVLAAHERSSSIHAAILCAPTIYGTGRGPVSQRSLQVNNMIAAVLARGKGFVVGDGLNRWTAVHQTDLSNMFVALVDAALDNGGKASWNKEGFYFNEAEEYNWGDLSRAVAKAMFDKKLISTPEVDVLTADEADKLHPWGRILWGTNSRGKAIRANKLLGWTPTQKSLVETLPEIIEFEVLAHGKP